MKVESKAAYEKVEELVTTSYYTDGKLELSKLCEDLSIDLVDFKFQDSKISGAITKKDENWKIYVDSNDSPRRKRFTVAHELGHYISYLVGSFSKEIMDSKGIVQDYAIMHRQSSWTPEEKKSELEANGIAARMLMPEHDVERLINDGEDIEKIADYFDVSESALTMRLKLLGYNLLEYPDTGKS